MNYNTLPSAFLAEGTISKTKVKGVVQLIDQRYYFFQNKKSGSYPNKTTFWGESINICKQANKFEYSWVFSVVNNSTLSDDVVITSFKTINLPKTKKEPFNVKPHPNCCGCAIAWDFNPNSLVKEKKRIASALSKYRTPIIAHLSSEQKLQQKLLRGFGFETMYTYRNPNSGNTISVMHFENEFDEDNQIVN